MRTNAAGVALIKEFEGCAFTAYQDRGGVWTIGWGRTRAVKPGDSCTQAEADIWLLQDISEAEQLMLNCIPDVKLTDNQCSALTSFVFNVGLGYPGQKDGFKVLKSGQPSTMIKCLMKGEPVWAAQEFPKWDKIAGEHSPGILRRRLAEQALFLQK